ncbi:XRE family transcriptional regulator [Nocardia cyriacigeorgica]|uniref:XRE family transcriptional regulator n=1 Tax=Nocardia cyriacigeorgica TaxID=135487 RepID=UPI00245659A6|nr:XRE family transcriptional regulator [Nocardia cyriacigeorgica]BDU07953.1 XRE family transcriptional regulator [Nocardia cyriacigeorgica]
MTNERLRGAMASANLTKHALAERLGISTKTVERWITQDRCPHPGLRLQAARALDRDETYLWPELLAGRRSAAASLSELVQIWPTRPEVPHEVWRSLMKQASDHIDVLVYAGGFLVESLDFVNVVRTKARAGVQVRILLGESDAPEVVARGREEGLPSLAKRCESTLEYLRETMDLPMVDIRTHRTTLYNSIYRFGDSLLVNTHSYGAYASKSPVQHLQKVPGGRLFAYYMDSFEAVWKTGRTVT